MAARTGGDLAPVDPVSDDGRLLLCAYVWADQVDRLERLRGACELAAKIPADLRQEPALATIAGLRPEPGTWTVLWHSIMRQYLDREEVRELSDGVAAIGAAATESARFAHVTLELAKGTLEGRNDWQRTGYGGPCPPIGRHRYFHKLYALDVVLPDMGRPSKGALEQAMKGHVLEKTELIGTYQKS